MLPGMLEYARKQAGWSAGRVAWELGITPADYRRLEQGDAWPDWETYDRIERLFGWPRTFVSADPKGR